MAFEIEQVPTTTYQDQKPGTSGLRKQTAVFMDKPNYTENFIQAIMDCVPDGSTIVVSGDGRFYNDVVLQKIAMIAAANGIKKMVIGQHGLLSTPAASHVMRTYKEKCYGGIILTASHNPGGRDKDMGIKFNVENGGPALENVTDKIWETTKTMTHYNMITDLPVIDTATIGENFKYGPLLVDIIPTTTAYVEMCKQIFDFPLIKQFLHDQMAADKNWKLLFDGMNGVTGPYGYDIFVKELGLTEDNLQHFHPSPNFGGMHPDPNLTYAKSLVDRVDSEKIAFGAASDGDGDRNMIYGYKAFVSPGDSLAIIAEYSKEIPYFQKNGVYGLARSFPTSSAVDRVAKEQGMDCYVTPTGWKFFGDLFDAKKISICGEESFGTGSNVVREKDGVWAIIAWLNILAVYARDHPGQKVSIKLIQDEFWKKYGRTFFTRYDFEKVDPEKAKLLTDLLRAYVDRENVVDSVFNEKDGTKVLDAGDFKYVDLNKATYGQQGLYVQLSNGCKFIVRLSGTGSSAATIRLYIEKYTDDASQYAKSAQDYMSQDIADIVEFLKFKEIVGTDIPTVIT